MPATTASTRPRRRGIWSATYSRSTWLIRLTTFDFVCHFLNLFHLFLFQGFPGYKCPEPNCEAVPFCLNYLDLHLHDVHGKQHPSEDLSQARLDSKDLNKSEERKEPPNTTISAKEKTLSSQEHALTELKTLPKLSCILCKNIFNSQMILKTHMKDEHKMSNEKINQVLCKLWMENNKKELEANSVSSDSSRDNFLRERTKTNFRNDSIKFQNQVLSKLWMENNKKELASNSAASTEDSRRYACFGHYTFSPYHMIDIIINIIPILMLC